MEEYFYKTVLSKRKKEEEKVKLNPQYSVLIKFKKYDEDQYNHLQFIVWVLENLLQ